MLVVEHELLSSSDRAGLSDPARDLSGFEYVYNAGVTLTGRGSKSSSSFLT